MFPLIRFVFVLIYTNLVFARTIHKRSDSLIDCGLNCDAGHRDVIGSSHEVLPRKRSYLASDLIYRSIPVDNADGYFRDLYTAGTSSRAPQSISQGLRKRQTPSRYPSKAGLVSAKEPSARTPLLLNPPAGPSTSIQDSHLPLNDYICMPPTPKTSDGKYIGPGLVGSSNSERLTISTTGNTAIFINTSPAFKTTAELQKYPYLCFTVAANIQSKPAKGDTREKQIENALDAAASHGNINSVYVISPNKDMWSTGDLVRSTYKKKWPNLPRLTAPTLVESNYGNRHDSPDNYHCFTFSTSLTSRIPTQKDTWVRPPAAYNQLFESLAEPSSPKRPSAPVA